MAVAGGPTSASIRHGVILDGGYGTYAPNSSDVQEVNGLLFVKLMPRDPGQRRFLGTRFVDDSTVTTVIQFLKNGREEAMNNLLEREWQKLDPESNKAWSRRDKPRAALLNMSKVSIVDVALRAHGSLPPTSLPVLRSDHGNECLWVSCEPRHLDYLVELFHTKFTESSAPRTRGTKRPSFADTPDVSIFAYDGSERAALYYKDVNGKRRTFQRRIVIGDDEDINHAMRRQACVDIQRQFEALNSSAEAPPMIDASVE